jgi:hypothetical protein
VARLQPSLHGAFRLRDKCVYRSREVENPGLSGLRSVVSAPELATILRGAGDSLAAKRNFCWPAWKGRGTA